jgi:hypothetical protein
MKEGPLQHVRIEQSVYKLVGNIPRLLLWFCCVSVVFLFLSFSLQKYSSSSTRRQKNDWSAVYLQFNIQHASETAGYRWDQGFDEGLLLRVDVRCDAVLVRDPLMGREDVKGETKAALMKRFMEIDENCLLMDSLGQKKQSLICLESAKEWELVVPHDLLPQIIVREEVVYRFRPNAYKATGAFCVEGSNVWQTLPGSGLLPGEVNEPPEWLRKLV